MRAYPTERLLGWLAVAFSTLFASLWAFWGVIENFHEGWYSHSLANNLLLMFGQYLIAMIVFLGFGLIGLKWPRIGAVVHVVFGCSLPVWFIRNNTGAWFLTLPMIVLGVLYWLGRTEPKVWAYRIMVGIPLVVLVTSGIGPAMRVTNRYYDAQIGSRMIEGNGVKLIWAPQGPGWPQSGVTWDSAMTICRHLSSDGGKLEDSIVNIWRLPTAEEVVRSATRHNANCGGTWNGKDQQPNYKIMPDKESPLWEVYSPVIYWWTSTEINDSTALIYVYNGSIYPRKKTIRPGYLGFRAVRETGP